jgi:hypothetical protein
VRRHTFWYKGADPEEALPPEGITDARHVTRPWFAKSNQQDGQRTFLESASTSLCANPKQTDNEYMVILHGMLDEVRTHINRHVHSAFWVKAACAEIDRCYDSNDRNENSPLTAVVNTTIPFLLKEANGCLSTVLEHEKYNLAEGFTFVGIQYTLLSRGAAFCTDPKRDAILSGWNASLEDAMAYHADNHGFDEMLDSHMAQLCTGPDEYEGQYDDVFAAVAEQIDADVLGEQDCSISDAAFDRMAFLSSNPPSALDAITIFEQNTWLTVLASISAARQVLSVDGCMDMKTRAVDMSTSATILSSLENTVTKFTTIGEMPSTGDTAPTAQTDYLGLPTVYHKLMMMCVADSEVSDGDMYTGVCRGEGGALLQGYFANGGASSSADVNPTFDIVTAADIDQCHGEACKSAALAILDYQDLLGSVTVLRWEAVRVASGVTPALPEYDQDSWTFQRSCSAMQSIVDNVADVSSRLPKVVEGLRSASPQMVVSCVSPMRNKSSLTRAAVILGAARAKNNTDLWESVDVGSCDA